MYRTIEKIDSMNNRGRKPVKMIWKYKVREKRIKDLCACNTNLD
jgi:hypothetical protein